MIILIFIAIWLFTFSNFISGNITIRLDTLNNYALYKYFYNNFYNGSIPLWDPFKYLGHHFFGFSLHGILSPMALLSSTLHLIGLNYYQTHMIFNIGNYFLGMAGFYFLARKIFVQKHDAVLATVLLLFSGLGAMAFNQINVLLIFTPVVWFVYFGWCFLTKFKPVALLGMVLALLVMSVSYLPGHLIVFLIVMFLTSVVFFPVQVKFKTVTLFQFIALRPWVCAGCGIILLIGLWPQIQAMTVARSGDYFFLDHHSPILYDLDKEFGPSLKMSYNEIALKGTLAERFAGGGFLSKLYAFDYRDDDFIYLPVLVYLLIFVSLWTYIDRFRIFLLVVTSITFFIALGAPGRVLELIYHAVPIVSYFRNQFYYVAFLMPMVVLFSVAQGRVLIQSILRYDQPLRHAQRMGIFHVLFLVLALWAGPLSWFTVGTIVLSGVFFVALSLGFIQRLEVGMLMLCAIALIEPLDVFYRYQERSQGYNLALAKHHAYPTFRFVRPKSGDERNPLQERNYQNFWYDMILMDSPGDIIKFPDVVNKWAYLYSMNKEPAEYYDLIAYKLRIYEHVPDSQVPTYKIEQENRMLRLELFDVNQLHIRTNISHAAYVEYAQAYSRYWKVYVDGQERPALKTNQVFTGVAVEPGWHDVIFKYDPPWGDWPVKIFFVISTLLTLFVFWAHQRKHRDEYLA